MDLNKIEEILLPYLEENNLYLYEIKWIKEYGYKVLQVAIDNKDGTNIDTDTLALCNEFLSKELDEYDEDMPEYMLEVCSPGAEKELRNKEEILKSVGKYIHIDSTNDTYEGDLLSFIDDKLSIKVNQKGRIKTIDIKYEDIKKIRLAVKF